MGRKANFDKKKKLGKGKKSKKQPDPVFAILNEKKDETTFSSHQKKRAKKRALKIEERLTENLKKQKMEQELPAEEKKIRKPILASDSEEDDDEEQVDSDLDSDEDNLTFDQKVKKINEEQKQIDEDDLKELESLKAKVAVEIPSLLDVQTELEENPDFDNLKAWIRDITYVLADLKTRNNGKSRSELIQILKTCLCHYYSYNEWLLEKLMGLFNVSDFLDFLEANEGDRPVTIRSNSLKARRKDLLQNLINRGVDVKTLNWTEEGLIVYKSSIALGATVEYFTGQYMIQSASSMLAVLALDPQPNELILDMCAAPGGKSTHIAALMKNTGTLCSNDVNKDRTKALVGNFHRMGVKNSVIINMDGRNFGMKMSNRFNRVLLDAPCSGTGIISKDPNIKGSKTDADIMRCSYLQRELLLSAILTVKHGGRIVYSTCSLLVEENEGVVDYALRKGNIKCIPSGLEVGTKGFVNYCGKSYNKDLIHSKRIYPHSHNMDGFFVAVLEKK